MRPRSIIATAAVVLGVAATTALPATAATPVSDPLVEGLVGPLQFDVSSNGNIYVGQAFAGLLTKVRPNGTTQNLVTEAGVTGVATKGYEVVYTVNNDDDPAGTVELLKRRFPNGTVRTLANLGRFEARHNPDAGNTYGFRNLTDECAAQVPDEVGGEPYPGQIDSNPYAVANAPQGGWYVADAGANAILYVSPKKRIKVVHVARPQKTVVTAEAAAALGLPDCVVGATYAFEPVPTDVEVNRRGSLIVSLLPGGPEDATLGARGAVLRISPSDGEWTRLAGGFLGATNVALAPHGKIFVAELFANRVSLLHRGHVTPVADLPSPAAVEYSHGTLYASRDAFGNGAIVTIRR